MLTSSCFLAAIFLFILWRYLRGDGDPLDDVPGPRMLPIMGNFYAFIGAAPREVFLTIREYQKTYGDRFVIKVLRRKILHINSPDDVECVLSSTKNITKSYPYTLLQPWLGTGLLLSTGTKWHRRRKILTPTFHFNILKGFLRITDENSRRLVQRLRQYDGQVVNVMPLVSDFTLHTICETAMGARLDAESPATVAYKESILKLTSLALKRLTNFWLQNDRAFRWSAMGKTFNEALEKVHTFADGVIRERKKDRGDAQGLTSDGDEELGSKRRLAMMDLLLEAEGRGHIDLEGIREEVNTFMFEGHDTTAMAISFGLMLLADHEDVQSKIFDECGRIFGNTDRVPEMADLSEMKYLEAVIKEIMRLYPSVPFIARTITEDFMIGDLSVRSGVEVAIHIYDLHRRPELYPEPELFRPERFLDSRPTHPYAYVPFSAGPRNCIGQRFAMHEMKSVLSEVCRAFRLAAVTPGARPALIADMILRPVEPIQVKFMLR